MTGPLKILFRHIALRKHSSDVPTEIRPLSAIRSVVVMTGADGSQQDALDRDIRAFFAGWKVQLKILTPTPKDVNWFGRLKKTARSGDFLPEELFISLVPGPDFTSEYEARCSRAVFKVGRTQLSGEVFDMVVMDASGEGSSQSEAFRTIADILKKVQ